MHFYKVLKEAYYNLLKLKSRVFSGRPVLVLMYHRINDDVGEKLEGLTVSVSNFEEQLLYFKNNFQVLKLDEDWNSLKKNGLVMTFDDGYADNILNALPLLEKYQIPATIFVTTLNINIQNEFWWDRLVFDYTSCAESFWLPDLNEKTFKSDRVYKDITVHVHKMSNDAKEKWFLTFEKLNQIAFSPREEFRSLTSAELQVLAEHPLITLGIHTHNHYSLGTLTYEDQKEELQLSIAKLSELTSTSIKYLALPHGSYNKDTLAISNELDISAILLANNYYSTADNKATKKINRILIPNLRDKELAVYINQFNFRIW